jgi:hypothetical protein
VLGFRQLRDVIAGVLESDKAAAARQRYWIIKRALPAVCRAVAALNSRCRA